MYAQNILTSLLVVAAAATSNQQRDTTVYNPALPGWHSDPSCVFVPDWNSTTFCTASSFLSTPGLPIIATKDLQNWKLVSHALTRPQTIPEFDRSLAQSDGIWAATIRYHDGVFYIATVFTFTTIESGRTRFGLIFNSTDPFNDDAWSDPLRYEPEYIDPDLFWDVDGKAYIASAGTFIQEVNLETGVLGEAVNIWNGTTGEFLEGPHIYRHDDYYYLMVAEGGSGLNHSVTIARSRNLTGPYEDNPNNPVLTNRDTDEFFQNIGHADLFQDTTGQWWSSALSWRSGPEGVTYPMGREMVLTPVTWPKGEWPEFSPVRGTRDVRNFTQNLHIGGTGPLIGEPDIFDFAPNSTLPKNIVYWRWPEASSYVISPENHPNTLQLKPSYFAITDGSKNSTAGYDIGHRTLATRKQTDTLFQYSIDIDFKPVVPDEEAGVTTYLNQVQNHAFGIVNLHGNSSANSSREAEPSLHFRFVTSAFGSLQQPMTEPVTEPVPENWQHSSIRMFVQAQNETHYAFSAAPVDNLAEKRVFAFGEASLLSGGQGDFTGKKSELVFEIAAHKLTTFPIFLGTLVGVYATSNRGNGTTNAYISRWRYNGLGQEIDNCEFVSSKA